MTIIKMWKILLILLAIVIIAGLAFYLMTSESSPSKPAMKKLVYRGETLVKSGRISYTSNGVDEILYGTENGLYVYKIDTGKTTKISEDKIIGLAYNSNCGTYFVLKEGGTLYKLTGSVLTFNYSGISSLYDTVDGYAIFFIDPNMASAFYGPGRDKNIGEYGIISFSVVNS